MTAELAQGRHPRWPSWRATYLLASLAVFFSQHLAVLAALAVLGGHPVALPWWFVFNPFRALMGPALAASRAGPVVLALGMIATLAADVALALLAFGRARRLNGHAWAAALTLVPVAQLAAVAWLAGAPRRPEADTTAVQNPTAPGAATVATGVLAGVGLIVVTVALSTLVFGLYGYALFLISPFLIAVVVGYLTNRRGRVGFRRTVSLTALAFLLGGAALVGFAFEGLVCLVLATPIIAVVGVTGAAAGAGLADLGRRGRSAVLSSVAVLPLLLVGEAALPPHAAFDSTESIEIAAPPSAVWDAVVRMTPIAEPPAAPFRWGLAYPLSAEVMGSGVGAVRRSVFSTGEAYERVTAWAPGRRLAFAVLAEPPAMRELSPYLHVNAPHTKGYFRTRDVRFDLTPLPGGRTRLTLTSRHDLEPALYWTPMAQWAVHTNTRRVLAHFRRQAEAEAKPLRS